MKVGDKILCKKDLEFSSIRKGWMCIIEEINGDKMVIKYDHRTHYYHMRLSPYYNNYFYDYFYTANEIRKLKLQKINGQSIL